MPSNLRLKMHRTERRHLLHLYGRNNIPFILCPKIKGTVDLPAALYRAYMSGSGGDTAVFLVPGNCGTVSREPSIGYLLFLYYQKDGRVQLMELRWQVGRYLPFMYFVTFPGTVYSFCVNGKGDLCLVYMIRRRLGFLMWNKDVRESSVPDLPVLFLGDWEQYCMNIKGDHSCIHSYCQKNSKVFLPR